MTVWKELDKLKQSQRSDNERNERGKLLQFIMKNEYDYIWQVDSQYNLLLVT